MTPNREEELKRRLKEIAESEGVHIVFSTDIVKSEEPTDVPIDAIKYLGKNEPLPTIQDRVFGYASGQDKRRDRRAKERVTKKEAALRAYPNDERKVFHSAFGVLEIDNNAPFREGYVHGYEQAEKDLAPTAEDVKAIFNKVRDEQFKYCATEGCYQEVADWFNEQRKLKKI